MCGFLPPSTARISGPSTLIRLPGDLVRPVFTRPAGVTYLADALSTGFATAITPVERALAGRPVGSLVHSDPVIVSAETSVRDAVRHMTGLRSSSALIPLGKQEPSRRRDPRDHGRPTPGGPEPRQWQPGDCLTRASDVLTTCD